MIYMSDRIFADTNILVYAHDLSAGERHAKASAVIESLWEQETGGPAPAPDPIRGSPG